MNIWTRRGRILTKSWHFMSVVWKIIKKTHPYRSTVNTTATAVHTAVPAPQISSQGCDLEGKLKQAIIHMAAIRLGIMIMVVVACCLLSLLLAACFVDQSITLVECDRSQEHTNE